MAQLSPYIHFDKKCTEAMEFYKSIFGGDLTLMKIGDSPMAADMPGHDDEILHSELRSDSITLMASDMGPHTINSEAHALCLVCGSKAELQDLYNKLAEGGSADQPVNDMFFGTYGDLTDKFGIKWMLQCKENK